MLAFYQSAAVFLRLTIRASRCTHTVAHAIADLAVCEREIKRLEALKG